MKCDPDQHHRRSIRLKGYDYAHAGAYFVTLCTHQRECLFGEVVNGKMVVNDYGRIVHEEWLRSSDIRREIELDAFMVMPNHIHGIVIIRDDSALQTIRQYIINNPQNWVNDADNPTKTNVMTS